MAGCGSTRSWVGAFILINTLIPLIVLHIAMRAAAPVTSKHVLTTMLTSVASITFIDIFAVQTGLIKRKSALTITAETSR